MNILSFLLLFALTSQLSNEIPATQIVTVSPSLQLQNYEHFRRLTLKTDNGDIDYIKGFDFEWGYEYKISVKGEKLKATLSDGTRCNYTLKKIISKTKVTDSTAFTLFIAPHRYYYEGESEEMNSTLKAINDSTFLYFENVEIEVPSELIAVFNQQITKGEGKLGHFTFVNEKRIRFVRF